MLKLGTMLVKSGIRTGKCIDLYITIYIYIYTKG